MIRISLRPPRFYVCGHRIHHGLFGAALALHDIRDARRWLWDFIKPPHVK